MWRRTYQLSFMMKKKYVWFYYHSIKKRFLDFPMFYFLLPNPKPWSFIIMPLPESIPWNHLSTIQFWCTECSHHQHPFSTPTESSRLWKHVCVIVLLQSFLMILCYYKVMFQLSMFVFFNSTTIFSWHLPAFKWKMNSVVFKNPPFLKQFCNIRIYTGEFKIKNKILMQF